MKGLEICGSTGDSSILVGESLQNLQNYIGSQRVVITTDKNIRHYYSKNVPPHEVIEVGTGERIRNLNYKFRKIALAYMLFIVVVSASMHHSF